MGSSHIKDENITIFMRTSKQFYIAGDYVQGQIYLRAAKPSQYTQLIISLHGEQYVYWSEGSGNSRRVYRNKYQNYNSYFVVMDFNGQVYQGDYVFPFAFLLPSMITGSFFHSTKCFLKYILKTQLFHPSQSKRSQFYEMFLNTLQPPRMALGPITSTHTVNSKCCGCCADYGTVSGTLNCDRNFVMNGDLIQVNGIVDNTRGTSTITSSTIMFERRRWQISSGGHIRNTVQEQFQLYKIGAIQPQNSSNFNFSATIPDSLVQCTAIGRILSMYYVVHLYTDYGCCANKADVQLHLIFHSRTPMIVRPQLVPQPLNWYPQVMQKVVYENMNAYMYLPDPRLPFVNLPQSQMMQNQETMMPTSTNYNKNQYPELNQQQKNWGINHSYQPVFYNDQMINDAQREYMAQKYGGNQTQNQLIRKL